MAIGSIALSVLSTSCSAGLSQGPSETLRAYARALEEKRVDDAYRLLSDEARRAVPLEAFRRMVLENPEDVMEVARALARPAADPTVHATVTMPSGQELTLVFQDGRWRIDAAAIDLYGQQTPRQALVGFLRAFERKRYDVILRYVPDAEREAIAPAEPPAPAKPVDGDPSAGPKADTKADAKAPDPAAPAKTSALPSGGELTADKLRDAWEGPQKDEMLRIAQALRAALPTATIEETGDVASMSYGSGATVSFVRERGAWKIRDF
jgi:hypothetical protein